MLYRFINEKTIRACPNNGFVGGRGISNLPRYLANNREAARAEGYKELVVETKPQIDNEAQYLTASYEDTELAIIQRWVVNDAPTIQDNSEELAGKIAELEEQINQLKQAQEVQI